MGKGKRIIVCKHCRGTGFITGIELACPYCNFGGEFRGIVKEYKHCNNCRHMKEPPICYIGGVPNQVSDNYVCEYWSNVV